MALPLVLFLAWATAVGGQTAAPDSLVPPAPTSKYRILRVHPPSGPGGPQAALGRYIANFGQRQGVKPGSVFRVYDGQGPLGRVRVERVWRDSASLGLVHLGRVPDPDALLPFGVGHLLIPQYVLLETVYFEAGEAVLTPDTQERLRFAARFMLDFPTLPILVEGHTDNSGDAAKNLVLSRQRAAQIRTYLEEVQRIPPERMHLRGYGQQRPLANNNTAEGRRLNRRVEILLADVLPVPQDSGAVETKKTTKK